MCARLDQIRQGVRVILATLCLQHGRRWVSIPYRKFLLNRNVEACCSDTLGDV